ncbi:M23 family metallopeptidase [Dactylosporangium sp. McL0621]|uniref:M23 family metallopeptidase n=1 Tax=Dactylosporangium sp. McL0621 TaxID=3415678 RepID=UPI003CE69571
MREKSKVTAGLTVAAGQPIGISGSTGHSSGPHVHYEIHINSDHSKNGAINPIEFMKKVVACEERGTLAPSSGAGGRCPDQAAVPVGVSGIRRRRCSPVRRPRSCRSGSRP